ncbi:MAG: hypothetical protein ACRCTP_16975 [Aeromonas popoffii]|uniref:hypothetical protein n=1 Tax=Aeromonas popoffii TaxID=70856 RepID=UPI003F31067B
MKKYVLSFLTMTMALSSGAAFAAETGELVKQNVKLTFEAPGVIQHDISAGADTFIAGVLLPNTNLATGSVKTNVTVNAIRVNFSGGESRVISPTLITAEFTGSGGDALKVGIPGSDGVDAGVLIRKGADDTSFEYKINSVGDQVITPGEYVVNVTAQAWND